MWTDLSDALLVSLAQLTTELEAVFLPLNRSSKYKEPQQWLGGLQREGVPPAVFHIDMRDAHAGTSRAKKAAACLLWMSGLSRQEIETRLMKFHRDKAAAGAVNQVRSRTIDLLPVVVRIAEIVRDVDLSERQTDLMLRLELGIPVNLLEVARACSTRISRAEYLRLERAGLSTLDAIADAKVKDIAQHLGGDDVRAKVARELVADARTLQQRAA